MKRNCLNCGQEFDAPDKEVKRGNGKYCSRKCSVYNMRFHRKKPEKHIVTCAYCGISFSKNKSKLLNSKSKLYFCCRAHKDISQRIGGIKEIQPAHYGDQKSDYREVAFSVHNKECNRCGYHKQLAVLCVHHKDRDRKNNSIDNLEILCPTCHMEEHFLAGDGLWSVDER